MNGLRLAAAPALAAVSPAVVDALRPLGVRHIKLPATPERVWRAIREAARGSFDTRGATQDEGWGVGLPQQPPPPPAPVT